MLQERTLVGYLEYIKQVLEIINEKTAELNKREKKLEERERSVRRELQRLKGKNNG